MEGSTHKQVVDLIKSGGDVLRLVVLSVTSQVCYLLPCEYSHQSASCHFPGYPYADVIFTSFIDESNKGNYEKCLLIIQHLGTVHYTKANQTHLRIQLSKINK